MDFSYLSLFVGILTVIAGVVYWYLQQQNAPLAGSRSFKNDRVFARVLLKSLRVLRGEQDATAKQEQKIYSWIKRVNPTKNRYTPPTKALCVKWILSYHTICNLYKNEPENPQDKDMQKAWKLLENTEANEKEERELDLLRLDIGLRLKSKAKLTKTFDRVVSRRKMNEQEISVAFTVAPILGRWKHTFNLGHLVMQANNVSLPYIHPVAVECPEVLDYDVLYKLSAEEHKLGDTPLKSLAWKVCKYKSLHTAFKDVRCDDRQIEENLRRNLKRNQSNKRWSQIPVDNCHMIQTGSVVQMMSLSAAKFPLVGPSDGSRIRVLGYMDMNPQDPVRLIESYSLQLSKTIGKETVWSGTYSLTQEHISPTRDSTHPVHILYEMILVLQEQ